MGFNKCFYLNQYYRTQNNHRTLGADRRLQLPGLEPQLLLLHFHEIREPAQSEPGRQLHYQATSGTFHRADGWNRFRQLLYQPERREDAVSGSQCRGELPHPVLLSFAGRHLAETTEHTQQSDAGKPIQPESELDVRGKDFESKTKVIQGSGSPQITRILHRMIIICWIYICNALHI